MYELLSKNFSERFYDKDFVVVSLVIFTSLVIIVASIINVALAERQNSYGVFTKAKRKLWGISAILVAIVIAAVSVTHFIAVNRREKYVSYMSQPREWRSDFTVEEHIEKINALTVEKYSDDYGAYDIYSLLSFDWYPEYYLIEFSKPQKYATYGEKHIVLMVIDDDYYVEYECVKGLSLWNVWGVLDDEQIVKHYSHDNATQAYSNGGVTYGKSAYYAYYYDDSFNFEQEIISMDEARYATTRQGIKNSLTTLEKY